jgi:hypothetical protein
MNEHLKDRDVTFTIEDGCLVRAVTGSGRSYTHRCPKQAFEKVAHAIEETPAEGQGTTLIDVVGREDLPFTQVNVALAEVQAVALEHRRVVGEVGVAPPAVERAAGLQDAGDVAEPRVEEAAELLVADTVVF